MGWHEGLLSFTVRAISPTSLGIEAPAGGREKHRCPRHLEPCGARPPAPSALGSAADGEVSPCVFTNLPVTGVTRVADGVERPYRGLTFGNVRDRSLSSLWGQIAYRNFRRSFYEERPPSMCQSCAKR